MAEAIIKGIISAGIYDGDSIFVSDILPDRLDSLVSKYRIQRAQDNGALASTVDTIVLSVKPQVLESVLGEIKETVGPNALILSIAAGKRIEVITNILGDVPVIRIMPNTPALVGKGASALFANRKAQGKLDTALKLFGAIGTAVVVEREEMLDAVTAVSGSGPAYFFLLMEEMIKAGIELGLPAEVCGNLVLQTALGSAQLAINAAQRGETPEQLRRKVTSPGGTTQAAIEEFQKRGLPEAIDAGIRRAAQRSRELSS
jgi:pyrroline-5-carboxylate reductase